MVISLTTIPSRISLIEATIDSLVAQELPIYVWIPAYTKKTDTAFTQEDIPEWLLDKNGVTVTIIPEDYGSISKLIPALENEVGDTIITVDDDCLYPANFAQELKKWMETYHNQKCLCYRGKVLTTANYRASISLRNVTKPRIVDIVTGVYGVLYKRDWFDVNELKELCKAYPGNDDIVISGYLDKKNIERVAIPFAPGETVREHRKVQKIDALWWSGNKHNDQNNAAIKAMGLARFSRTIFGRILLLRNPFLIPSKVTSEKR